MHNVYNDIIYGRALFAGSRAYVVQPEQLNQSHDCNCIVTFIYFSFRSHALLSENSMHLLLHHARDSFRLTRSAGTFSFGAFLFYNKSLYLIYICVIRCGRKS